MSIKNITNDNVKAWLNGKFNTLEAENLIIDGISLEDFADNALNGGVISGFDPIVDNVDGTIDIPSGEVYLRTADNDNAKIVEGSILSISSLPMTDLVNNYIYVDYNAGIPIITSTTSENTITENDKILLYVILRRGIELTIQKSFQYANNNHKRDQEFLKEKFRNTRTDGLVLGETGLRNVTVTMGTIWTRFNKLITTYFDSFTGSLFDRYFLTLGVYTRQIGQSTWDNAQWNDVAIGLSPITVGRYSYQDFYMLTNDTLVSMYGTSQDSALSQIENADIVPIIPELEEHSIYIGRIVFQQGAITASSILSPFGTDIDPVSSVGDHTQLINLNVDSHLQYVTLANRGGETLDIDNINTDQINESTAFANITMNNKTIHNGILDNTLTASQLVSTDISKNLVSTDLQSYAIGGTNISIIGDAINNDNTQALNTTDTPTFASVSTDQLICPSISCTCGEIVLDSLDNTAHSNIYIKNSDPVYKANCTIEGKLIIEDTLPTGDYALSIGRDSNSCYMEIRNNNSGVNKAVFFGLEGDSFPLYNWQGGSIRFLTDTVVSSGQDRLTINNDGEVQIFDLSASRLVRTNINQGLESVTGVDIQSVIDDDSFATASATSLATSESTKAYVDNHPSTTIWSRSGTDISPQNAGDALKMSEFEPETGTGSYRFNGNTISGDCIINASRSGSTDICQYTLATAGSPTWRWYMNQNQTDYVLENASLGNNVMVIDSATNQMNIPYHLTVGSETIAPAYSPMLIWGPNASLFSPSIEMTTSTSVYPVTQLIGPQLGLGSLLFDCFHENNAWYSSSLTSNIRQGKGPNGWRLYSDAGITPNAMITWDLALEWFASSKYWSSLAMRNTIVSASPSILYVDSSGKIGVLSSNAKDKDDITDIVNPLDIILSLRPRQYYRFERNEKNELTTIHDPSISYGLIAEEVETTYPLLCKYKRYDNLKEDVPIPDEKTTHPFNDRLVLKDEPELCGVKNDQLSAVCIGAIKELNNIIETQKKTITNLTNQISVLQSRDTTIEARISALESYHAT